MDGSRHKVAGKLRYTITAESERGREHNVRLKFSRTPQSIYEEDAFQRSVSTSTYSSSPQTLPLIESADNFGSLRKFYMSLVEQQVL